MTKRTLLCAFCAVALPAALWAQNGDKKTTEQRISELEQRIEQLRSEVKNQAEDDAEEEVKKPSRFQIGGYGEAAYSRNFYSDNPSRYSNPTKYKDDPSHGRFDIPHVVVNMGYNFGKGWSMGMELEFEHGGTGVAYEKEDEEGGEWEQETEKGGEVEVEQFWLQKSFAKWLNLRVGHIVVPVGLNNAHHEPLNFFTVYRPEGENTIIPSTWHQTGFSLWGEAAFLRYELQLLAGLSADHFTNTGWINKGAKSPLEFDIANKYGLAGRVDFYIPNGPRMGISGYYGESFANTYPNNATGVYQEYKGKVAVGSIDLTYDAHNIIVRAQATYGYLGDAGQLKYVTNRKDKLSPYHHSAYVSKNAYAYGVEAGYDVFSPFYKLRRANQKLYVFGRYEHYNPYASVTKNTRYDYTDVKRLAVGLNYKPMKQIVVKAEYSHHFLKSQYNNEPSINIGIAYEGWFIK